MKNTEKRINLIPLQRLHCAIYYLDMIWPPSLFRKHPYKDYSIMPFNLKYDCWHMASCAAEHVQQS